MIACSIGGTSSSATALQDIVGGVYICTHPPVSCIRDCGVAILSVLLPLNLALVLGPLDRVKHSDICVGPNRSWNAPQISVRPAWPRLHYTEYPRPAAALTRVTVLVTVLICKEKSDLSARPSTIEMRGEPSLRQLWKG